MMFGALDFKKKKDTFSVLRVVQIRRRVWSARTRAHAEHVAVMIVAVAGKLVLPEHLVTVLFVRLLQASVVKLSPQHLLR